ncbi:unnamed protein product [Caenorhabditis brenneri]
MEFTAAYAMISKLQKENAANRNAMAKQAAETRASLLHNSETIAQSRGKVESLETNYKTLETDKKQVVANLTASKKTVKALEEEIATYLEAAKKNALDVEDLRQTQQKIIDNLQKDKNADKLKKKEEKQKKHQEESRKKTERLEKDRQQ